MPSAWMTGRRALAQCAARSQPTCTVAPELRAQLKKAPRYTFLTDMEMPLSSFWARWRPSARRGH